MTLFHQVRAAHREWIPYEAEGTVFGAINKAQLELVSVPAIEESRGLWLEEKLVAMESHIATLLVENERLVQTRDELLPLLMAGKIRVRDAERQVEEQL